MVVEKSRVCFFTYKFMFNLFSPNKHHENIKKKQFINLKNPLKILKIQNQPGKKNSLDPNLPFQFRYRFKNTSTGPLIE